MKIVRTFVISALLAITALTAQARSMKTEMYLQAELEKLYLDPKLNLKNIDGGVVVVSYDMFEKEKNFIQVTLFRSAHCPEGLYCIQMVPAPYIIKVPLIDSKKDSCGSIIYKGKLDLRSADGDYNELTVIDNTRNKCKTLIALPPTEVNHTSITAGYGVPVIKAVSKMTGKALK